MSSVIPMEIVFRGTTEDCLKRFAAVHGSREKRVFLAEFLGVNENSVRRWFSFRGEPYGENLIRIRYILEALGFYPRELVHLPEAIRNLGRAIAFHVISMDEAIVALDFESENPQQSVFRILLGKCGTTPLRESVMNDLSESKALEVKQQIAKFREEMDPVPSLETERSPVACEPQLSPSHMDGALRRCDAMEVLAHLACAMLPLAEALASDDFSSKDRQKLREMAKGDGIFRLSTALNRLCGERARKHYETPATAVQGGVR